MEEKEKLIGDLYALRAGLSVISQEKDKTEQYGKKAFDCYGDSLTRQRALLNDSDIGSFDFVIRGREQEFDSAEEMDAFANYTYKVGFLSTWTREGYSDNDYEDCYSLAYFKNRAETEQRKVEEERRKFLQVQAQQKNERTKKHGLFAAFKKRKEQPADTSQSTPVFAPAPTPYTEIVNLYPAWLKEIKSAVTEMETNVIPLLDKCDALYSVLQKEYAPLLDERDWKYVDLILFYLETGRADNMKEALKLVEREIQTQRIINKLDEATKNICKSIEFAASKISAQLSSISTQIGEVIRLQNVQVAQNDKLIEATNKQVAQNNRLIAAANMQNALLAKANETSEQLMNDVSFIKNYGVKSVGR